MVDTSLIPSSLLLLACLASPLPLPLESSPASPPTLGEDLIGLLKDKSAEQSLGSSSGKEDRAESTLEQATEKIKPDGSWKETLDVPLGMSTESKLEKTVNNTTESTKDNLIEETLEQSLKNIVAPEAFRFLWCFFGLQLSLRC